MDRRTRTLFAAILIGVIAATLGAAVQLSGSGVGGPDGSATAPSVDGVIVGVQSEGLDRVVGFDLRTEDGMILAFTIGTLENGAVFPPGHLVEHQATAQPIRVWYRDAGGSRIAIRLEDAP